MKHLHAGKIPAIVLSYDANHKYALHCIMQYERLWPDHPFTFFVPYQDTQAAERFMGTDLPVVLIPTPSSIRATVLTLLELLPAEAWVYWCIDDKFPIQLDRKFLAKLVDRLFAAELERVDGICFCRTRKLLNGKGLMTSPFGMRKTVRLPSLGFLFRRRNYAQIWLHQFLRTGVLRELFLAFPADVAAAKMLDQIKDTIPLPDSTRLFVTSASHCIFGESTSRGLITANCAQSMLSVDLLEASDGIPTAREMVIGLPPRRHRFHGRLLDILSIITCWTSST